MVSIFLSHYLHIYFSYILFCRFLILILLTISIQQSQLESRSRILGFHIICFWSLQLRGQAAHFAMVGSISMNENQWLDLPDDLIERVFERLSFTDHIRCAAVCTRWLKVHDQLATYPNPPRVRSPPWLAPSSIGEAGLVVFYSPFENTSYPISAYGNCQYHLFWNEQRVASSS